MIRLSRVLAATDLCNTARHSLQYAVSLARRYQAELFVQHVVPDYFAKFPHWTTLFDVRQLQDKVHNYVARELANLIPPPVRDELIVKEVLSRGDPAHEIVRFAQDNAADMIVIGARDPEKTEVADLGSTVESVIRSASCPVLTVPTIARDFVNPADFTRPVQPRHILFPTDFSEYSKRALDYALGLSIEYRSKLTLLFAVEYEHAIHYEIERHNLAHNMTAVQHWAENQLLKHVPEDYQRRVSYETRVVKGQPYKEILRTAEELQTDLIVMGAHGWSPIKKFFLGTATEKVIRRAHNPVLTVKF